MNPLLLSSLIAGALGFGSAWTWQGYRIDAIRLEQANEQLAREQSIRQQLAEAQTKVTQAQAAAQLANDRVRRDAHGANVAGVGMRDALASAVRSAAVDLTACTQQVATLSELFSASTELSRSIAAEADQWAVERVMLQEAWPK